MFRQSLMLVIDLNKVSNFIRNIYVAESTIFLSLSVSKPFYKVVTLFQYLQSFFFIFYTFYIIINFKRINNFVSEDYFIQWTSSRPPIWMKFVSKSPLCSSRQTVRLNNSNIVVSSKTVDQWIQFTKKQI